MSQQLSTIDALKTTPLSHGNFKSISHYLHLLALLNITTGAVMYNA